MTHPGLPRSAPLDAPGLRHQLSELFEAGASPGQSGAEELPGLRDRGWPVECRSRRPRGSPTGSALRRVAKR
jgi:hypothetical protein